jgi:hypothetical protein
MVDNDPPAAKKAAPKKLNNKVGPGSAPTKNDTSTPTKTAPGKVAAGGSGAAKSVTPAKKAPVSGGSASSAAKDTAAPAAKPARSAIGSRKPIQSAPTPSTKKPAAPATGAPAKKPAAPAAGQTQKATGTAQKSAGSAVGQAQKSATGKAPTPVKKPAGAGTFKFLNGGAHTIVLNAMPATHDQRGRHTNHHHSRRHSQQSRQQDNWNRRQSSRKDHRYSLLWREQDRGIRDRYVRASLRHEWPARPDRIDAPQLAHEQVESRGRGEAFMNRKSVHAYSNVSVFVLGRGLIFVSSC